jgi:serine/threonine protein kinase
MVVNTEYILSEAVEIFPVGDLPIAIRSKISAEDTDFALTKRQARDATRVLDADSACFVKLFRVPRRIVDAVLLFSNQNHLNPESTFEECYALICELRDAGVLVPVNEINTYTESGDLPIGTVIEGYQIIRRIQSLEDTGVYIAKDVQGCFAAIKWCSGKTSPAAARLEHEAQILQALEQCPVPSVYWFNREDSGAVLITEWIYGENVASVAAGLRGDRQPRCELSLLELCISIIGSFARLHDQGILHGDIHPKNILVDARGNVTLIDLGLAQNASQHDFHSERGGVAFYYSPAFAKALREGAHVPFISADEQYSLGALLYQLWTGFHYLDWTLERTSALQQIICDEPVAFEDRGVPPSPTLEAALRRTLEKDPSLRFATLTDLELELKALLPKYKAASVDYPKASLQFEANLIVDEALASYRLARIADIDVIPTSPPFASLTYGAAGIAYALYRVAQDQSNAGDLSMADLWIERAYKAAVAENGFYASTLGITPDVVGPISLFHTESGLHCIRALISLGLGDFPGAARAVDSFLGHSRRPGGGVDLTLGAAGILIGLCELVEEIPFELDSIKDAVVREGDLHALSLTQLLKSESLSASTEVSSLGVAHGWAGIIYALLRWTTIRDLPTDSRLEQKLEELAGMAQPHAAGLRWPIHNASKPPTFTYGWCNGTAGQVLLFAKACEVFGSNTFGELVERGSESAWATESQLGSLCCGLGGVGYALLAAYRVTGSERWLDRARVLTLRSMKDSSPHFRRDALYKGGVGIAMLANDLAHPARSAMPMFESRWSAHDSSLG